MLNLLQILRYLVFVVFIICNAVITSVAVWNLSIVQTLSGSAFTTAKQIDSFLIFLGAAGLVLIFPILFSELYGKNLVVGRVWFELLWVGVFWLMQLAGAAALTAQGTAQFCSSSQVSQSSQSPCASTQVLQAFAWIIAILMLGYFTLLSILTIVKYNDDPTILKCSVRRFPVVHPENPLKSEPASPRFRLAFRPHVQNPTHAQTHIDILNDDPAADQQHPTPAIVAPQPRRHFAALRAAILAHRHSGGDDEPGHSGPQRQTSFSSVVSPPLDEDERNRPSSYYPETMMQRQQQNMTTVFEEAKSAPPVPPVPAPAAAPAIITVQPSRPRPALPPAPTSVPFYNSAVRLAMDGEKSPTIGTTIRPLPSIHAAQAAKPSEPPSPPPLGDWPRMDATSRPRTKRKQAPADNTEQQLQPLTRLNMLLDRSKPEASGSIPQPLPQAPSQPQPQAASSRVHQPLPQLVASSSSTRIPESGFAAQTWQQTYGAKTESDAPRAVEVARQPSISPKHERPQRRPSAALPRPPAIEARRASESRSPALYRALSSSTPADPARPAAAPAPVPIAVAAPPPPPASTSTPGRKESVRRPLPVPQPLPIPQSLPVPQPQPLMQLQPQPPPVSAPLGRADSSTRALRQLPPPPIVASQGPPDATPTSLPMPSWRHRPGGPRRQSNDGDQSPPPPGLDRYNSIGSSEYDGHY